MLFPRYSYLLVHVLSNAGSILRLFHLLLPTATNLHSDSLVFPTSLAAFKLDSPELPFFGLAQFFL